MSVKGCYTDFHIDFGGTSVWYHILKGQKVFWLIPPSEKNIQLYEQWVLSGKQSDIFFGDTVEQCARVRLHEGYTFFIPTGWIHAVYTPEDSLVFGGNILHSFGIEKQLRIAQVEDVTKVPVKFRYPFYNELLWYVLERYVHCVSGKTHQTCNEDGSPLTDAQKATNQSGSLLSQNSSSPKKLQHVHLTPFELNGLKAIIMWLSRLSNHKRALPELIDHSEALLNDAKLLVDDHATDDHALACTGKSVLFWTTEIAKTPTKAGTPGSALSLTAQLRQMKGNLFSSFKNSPKVSTSTVVVVSGSESSQGRPESPPTRPLSSNQYTVNSNKILDQIPSSFADLIAATGGVPNVTAQPLPATMSFSTQTMTPSPQDITVIENAVVKIIPLDRPVVSTISPLAMKDDATVSTPVVVNGTTIKTEAGVTPNGTKPSATDNSRRRRTRCKNCEACVRADCGECHFCKDMKKFGGPGRMKQSCIARQCMSPILPHTACCMICGRDGWEKMLTSTIDGVNQSSLMECSQCWEIVHPVCLKEKDPDISLDCAICEDLPNSWECPKCAITGKSGPKPKPVKTAVILPPSTTPAVKRDVPPVSTPLPVKKLKTTVEKVETSDDEPVESSESEGETSSSTSHISNAKTPDFPIKTSDHKPIANSFSSISPVSYVKSSARFPLLQEAIKQQQDEKAVASSSGSLKVKDKSSASKVVKKGPESLKDRLFKSLKSLKKKEKRPGNGTTTPLSINVIPNKKPPKTLSIKTTDSSSCSSSALNSPSIPPSATLSGKVSIKSEPFDPEEHEVKSLKTQSTFDDETDDDTDPERSTLYSKSSDEDDDDDSRKEEGAHKIKKHVVKRELIKPMYVVRPAPLPEDVSDSEQDDEPEREEDESSEEETERAVKLKYLTRKFRRKLKNNLALERDVVLPVLPHLPRTDLMKCMYVCRLWNSWCMDPSLWETMNLSQQRINSHILCGIVRRQPVHLDLSWTRINKTQMSWLIARLPRLQTLSLSGCSVTAVSALCTCSCPLLRKLDLSWVDSLDDELVRELASPPADSRPGLNETKTRLRLLTEINLSGADITDASVRLLSHNLPLLTNIDLSNCEKVTDMGIAFLGSAKAAKLISLRISACNNISDTSLDSLKRCLNLSLLDLRDCHQVSPAACQKFISCPNARNKFVLKQSKLIEARV